MQCVTCCKLVYCKFMVANAPKRSRIYCIFNLLIISNLYFTKKYYIDTNTEFS